MPLQVWEELRWIVFSICSSVAPNPEERQSVEGTKKYNDGQVYTAINHLAFSLIIVSCKHCMRQHQCQLQRWHNTVQILILWKVWAAFPWNSVSRMAWIQIHGSLLNEFTTLS